MGEASAAIEATRGARTTVAALAATTTVGYGVLFYAYGVLLVPMQDDLGWSRTFLTGAFSTALVVSALLTLVVGRWLDRHPPRPLFLLGAGNATVLVVAWGLAHGKVAFVVVWALLGGCQAILFYEPAFTMLTKWLRGAQRHRAVTAVTLLAGLASTIFSPLTAVLEHALGWRGAVLVLGGLLGLVTIPCFIIGLRAPPLTSADPPDPATSTAPAIASPRDALSNPQFWRLTTAYLLSAVTTYAVAVHLVPYLRDRGLGSGTAASALGAVGLVQVLGRSTFARLTARRSALELGTWILGAKALGLALLLALPGAVGIVLFVTVYGAANGLATLTRATAVAELYGAEHYGSISSVVASFSAFAGALAPFVVAAAIDAAGTDEPVLWGLVAISVLAAVMNARVASSPPPLLGADMAALPPRRRQERRVTRPRSRRPAAIEVDPGTPDP
jgi:MFS family permease